MIKEMAPTIYAKHGLGALEKGSKWKSLSQEEAFSSWNGGAFYKAVQEFFAQKSSAKNLMGNAPDLSEDYEFWIRTCVRRLFVKYQSMQTPTWSAAVQAFNGSGPGAVAYKKDVMSRVGAATIFR